MDMEYIIWFTLSSSSFCIPETDGLGVLYHVVLLPLLSLLYTNMRAPQAMDAERLRVYSRRGCLLVVNISLQRSSPTYIYTYYFSSLLLRENEQYMEVSNQPSGRQAERKMYKEKEEVAVRLGKAGRSSVLYNQAQRSITHSTSRRCYILYPPLLYSLAATLYTESHTPERSYSWQQAATAVGMSTPLNRAS